MPDNTKSENTSNRLANTHVKWEAESAKIRKVQISLDFPDAADILLRTLAAREHKAPSSMIREIVGMSSSPPKRARIGVSFNDQELHDLGQRYDIDPNDKAEIRRRLTEEVTSVLTAAETEAGETALQSENKKTLQQQLEQGAMKDLKTVSDGIHQRFQRALSKRNDDKT